MKKAFEKILEKLEEYEYENLVEHDSKMVNHCKQDCNDVIDCTLCVWDKAIEIVKQEAEKFGTDINVVSNGWIPCSERLPDRDKNRYIVQKTNGFIDILGFTKDAYKLSRYDFAEYKGKKKQMFYDYDSEYGYSELECEAWQPLPEPFEERD